MDQSEFPKTPQDVARAMLFVEDYRLQDALDSGELTLDTLLGNPLVKAVRDSEDGSYVIGQVGIQVSDENNVKRVIILSDGSPIALTVDGFDWAHHPGKFTSENQLVPKPQTQEVPWTPETAPQEHNFIDKLCDNLAQAVEVFRSTGHEDLAHMWAIMLYSLMQEARDTATVIHVIDKLLGDLRKLMGVHPMVGRLAEQLEWVKSLAKRQGPEGQSA